MSAPPIMRLGAVLGDIGAQLPPTVTYRVGGLDEVAKGDPSRRIVMEPSTRSYEGGRGGNRVLFTRVETVRMHIWGKSMSDVEELEELLINAINASVAWAIRPGTGTWRLRAVSERGFLVTQEMAFLIPIVRRETKGQITGAPIEPVFDPPAIG